MRLILPMLVAIMLGLSVLTACQDAAKPVKVEKIENRQPTPAPAPVADDGHDHSADRITLADAKKDFDSGQAVFIDTRAVAAWRDEHIKGSINIPAEAPAAEYSKIPKGKKIIAYCS